MDGYVSGGISGILFAEDFAEDAAQEPLPPLPPLPSEPERPALTDADLDAACALAVRDAASGWAQSAAERRGTALDAIAAQLDGLRAAAAAQAERVAEGVAQAVLGMVAAALPSLARTHGDAEVRALVREIVPLLGPDAGVVVRAGRDVLDLIRADLAGQDEELAGAVTLRAAALPSGDVRITWEGGGLRRDGAAIAAAVGTCLGQLGLLPPERQVGQPTERNLVDVG